jgi:adenylyltransferase/sulfurtransferase
VLPGIVGSLQANEVIKVITGIGDPLNGRLFLFDALTFETRTLKVHKDPEQQQIVKLIDYELFCGLGGEEEEAVTVKEVTVQELEALKDRGEDFQLIDVREPYEYEIANLSGTLIPLAGIQDHVDQISSDKKVVVHCRSGARSAQAIQTLEKAFGFNNLYNLKGGILAYADEIDNSLAKY